MPTSAPQNITTVISILTQLAPRRVLDIGCGFGKYGVLAREYLDVWHGRLDKRDWTTELIGIEAHAPYRNPIHDFVYDKVHYTEAQAALPSLGSFDAALMLDVIEHFEKPAARELVRDCLARSRALIISTPSAFYPQAAHFDNRHEEHHSLWTRDDFDPGVQVRTIRVVACDIFVASREALPDSVFALADPADVVYLRSRQKLGPAGFPLSLLLKGLNRLLS
ncbi:MAG TPA: methyltransferase domain-containing protein [Gemmatimonadales bacterium]